MIRVLIADDQAMVRGALAALLNLEDDIDVVAEAANGEEALTAAASTAIDVALLDIEMPKLDGIETTAALRARHPDIRCLIVTTFGRPGYLRRALDAGARGFVVKETPAEKLAEAVRKIHAGQRVVDPALATESLFEGANPLTEREQEILRIARDGEKISNIAKKVHLSEGTVRNYLSSAIHKTGSATRAAAAKRAEERGWL
ncbi:response regulator transcription factor [Dermabacter sp. p3-SID358]|uniref:response regulator transcription factor n=1 Tax=Dermabacter sp. p3-SID358 TaxID=2916114 RepID=UPI0021A84B85|nr:response regulator transcription factor [Dermabacter sp. p3-SID358]MCT1866780.1 response regulator transcription factor [Dermabacter sp. p3-SID358]